MTYSKVFLSFTVLMTLVSFLIIRNVSNDWTDKGSYQTLYAIHSFYVLYSDPLFTVLINASIKLGIGFTAFYNVTSIYIFIIIAFYASKIERINILQYLLFLLSFPVYKLAFINVRQGLALAVVLTVVLLLKSRKSFILEVFAVSAASLFHVSAIFTLFINRNLHRKHIIALSILLTIILLFNIMYISRNSINVYRNDLFILNDKSLVSLIYLCPLALLAYFQPKINFVSIWFLPTLALFFLSDYWMRILYTIYVACFPYLIFHKKHNKLLAYLISLMLAGLTLKDVIEIA